VTRLSAAIALGCTLLGVGVRAVAAEPTTLKLASLAPEGSAWARLLTRFADRVEQQSAGRLRIKLQQGASAGDEREMVRKMRFGELAGAALTQIGLSLIQSEVLVLELPFLIKTYEELDYVRARVEPGFRKRFEERGFVFLGWGDVGPVHLFSALPIRSRADLRQLKLWAWLDDPIARALFAEMNQPGVPLALPDVLPSLKGGVINACYGSPLATLALQWYTQVKYMISVPLTQSIGAAVLSKRELDRLPADLQAILVDNARTLAAQITRQVREDNVKALAALKRAGLVVIDAPPEVLRDFQAAALAVRPKLEPRVYSHALRLEVERLLAEYHQAHP